jgi:hypothetical protein
MSGGNDDELLAQVVMVTLIVLAAAWLAYAAFHINWGG